MEKPNTPLVPFDKNGNDKPPSILTRVFVFCFASFWTAIFGGIAFFFWRMPTPPSPSIPGTVARWIFLEIPIALTAFMASMAILAVVGPGGKFHRFVQKRGLVALLFCIILLIGPFVLAILGALFGS